MTLANLALALFVLAYVLFFALPRIRSWVAAGVALLLLMTGCLTPGQAFWAINWNVMGIFVGTLVLAEAFIRSKAPAYLAEIIVNKAPNTAWAMLFICMLTSFLSIFIENVATVLIVAPIALSLAKKLNVVPIQMMIGIAICSNLQGTATLIGDPPSMLLGGYAKMNFLDFFFYQGKPSIFFAVEIGAVVSTIFLYFVFRHLTEKQSLVAVELVQSWGPTLLLVALIIALALSSFVDPGFGFAAGILCIVFGLIALAWIKLVHKGSIRETVKGLDWDTTAFLMGIFIIVYGFTEAGWTDALASHLAEVIGDNVFLGYSILVLLAVIVSAFVDNVPFLAAMLPVATKIAQEIGIAPQLFLFGLLIGASLGGNVTPIGASANIVATGLVRKEGHEVTLPQWLKISIPFTVAAVLPAYLFIWFIWR
ncbi:MAG: anion permease [Candidatus Hydrogenedentes bacterium]|nr:anion permease [Candidatus Hydrogenedentota bacterium]